MDKPKTEWTTLARRLVVPALFAAVLAVVAPSVTSGGAWAQTNDPGVEADMPTTGNVPGESLGNTSDSEIWRAVRQGIQGEVSIPDKKAGVLVQSEGDNWRAWRNGPLTVSGIWVVLGMLGLLALYFAIRGRIRVDRGMSGDTIERFNGIERFAHWLTASTFIILGLTGLNMLYGRHVLLPVLGYDAFAALTLGGKYAHNYLAFGFMIGVVLMFVLWIRDNLPNRYDLSWIAKGGGLFSKGVHPPSRKFNAGQKLIFWVVVLGGLSLSLSGIALLFPFQFAMFEPTFNALNAIGFRLPSELTAIEEMQLSQLWHGFVGLIMIAIILAHIYIGSLGMEGAFAAMGSGQVDENWAREHHNVWVAELKGEPHPDPDQPHSGATQAAE
ncbi:MAG TPA: formate dehydrogenase subunit gamma [Kiloniellales bacterium]